MLLNQHFLQSIAPDCPFIVWLLSHPPPVRTMQENNREGSALILDTTFLFFLSALTVRTIVSSSLCAPLLRAATVGSFFLFHGGKSW